MQTLRWTWITLVSLAGCGWHLNGQTSIDLTRQGAFDWKNTCPAAQCAGRVVVPLPGPAARPTVPSTGALTLFAYPQTNAAGFKVCNYTARRSLLVPSR